MTSPLRLACLALIAAMMAAPALADGRDGTSIVTPTPLQPHAQNVCDLSGSPHAACLAPVETRRVVRRFVQAPAVAQTVQPQHDFSSFNGGVGANVAMGGYFAGGNVIIVQDGGSRFSGVTAYSSARTSFAAARSHHGRGCSGCGSR